MTVLSQTVPLPSSARVKVDQALRLVGPARQDNAGLKDVFESAEKLLEGAEPHLKAIEFDRPSRDVSGHGSALRGQAGQANQRVDAGAEGQASLETAAARIEELIDGALADLGNSNNRAGEKLRLAKSDLDFARESTISTTGTFLRQTSKLLGSDLDPYLTEVEADEPGRDVGRFADDIAELWKNAHSNMGSGPIYTNSTERSLEKVLKSLESARSSL